MCFTSMSANLENSVVATRTGKGHFSFQFQRIFKLTYNCIQSFHTVKILQARLQQCLNQEHADLWGGFWRGRGNRDQIVNTCWIMEKAREFQKNIYFCFIDYAKAFDSVDHNKLENSSRDGNTRPPSCLLRNLFAGQEATVRTLHGTTYWFKFGKGVW